MLLAHDVKDIYQEDGTFVITCDLKALDEVKNALTTSGYTPESAEVEWVPKDTIELGKDAEDKAYEFLSSIEELDDVQNVYTNVG